MITDLANLGPSNRTTSDLGANSKKEFGKNSQSEKSGSFDQIFQQKNLEKKSDQKVRSEIEKPNDSEPRTAQKEKTGDEPGSVKDKGRSEKVGKKANNKSPDRQEVMLKFMDSMESEFGIPPTQMVEAMTNLSTRDLKASPEDSASQVIAQLDLPKEDEQKAYAMYMAMVNQLSQQPIPAAAYSAPPPLIVAGGAAVFAAPEQRRSMVNHSLDQMNQKFFMQGPAELKPSGNPDGLIEMNEPPAEALAESKVDSPVRAQVEVRPDPGTLRPLPGKVPLQDQMQAMDPSSAEAQEMAKKLAALSFAAGTLAEDLKADPKNLQAQEAERALKKFGTTQDSTAMAMVADAPEKNPFFVRQAGGPSGGSAQGFVASSATLAALAQAKGSNEDSGDFSEDSPSQNSSFAQQTAQPLPHHVRTEAPSTQQNFGAMMAAAGAQGANQAASQSENKAAVQQLMNQAEFMIRKGGGEAKVQLNPEGLGEIQMKVSVADGKVGIQMSAETKEAKKLIEGSLHDLRSSLSEHKLSVGHVSVDVGNQASSDNKNSDAQSQQKQMDMNQDQSRGQTREFWNQFHENSERRNGFMENTGIRAYGGPKSPEPLNPGNTTVAEKRFSGSGKGRGLNLVA